MTTTARPALAVRAPTPTNLAARVDAVPPRTRRRLGYALLALLAYVPVMLTAPGRVAADTKQYLYLDPGRLMSRAWSMWDPNVGMGTVTHQNIGYLFPMGPFYWVLEQALGLPQWAAQRLWLGSILFLAGLGMLYLWRTIGLRGPGAVVGALAFMLTPYTLDYAARISVILLPWAGLPWILAFVVRGLREGGWKYPALLAITVQAIGSVNATALIFSGIAPVLWVPYAVWVLHEVEWRRALLTLGRFALLSVLTSLWWMSGLWAQGTYGLNVLRFTETLFAVSRTSTPNEVLRDLGYWFFYGRDKLGPWIEASVDYTQWPLLILLSYGITVLALVSAAAVRWRYRAYFVLLVLVGTVIAVGAHPYSNPTPLGQWFKDVSSTSTAAFAMRSTGRATPLVVLGLAALLAAGVNAAWAALVRRRRASQGLLLAGVVGVLVVANLPALWNGTFYGKNLQRPEQLPTYRNQAHAYLDRRSHSTRILEEPGSDFASYRWGNTVDPVTPGVTDRPYVARELIPYGSPASADLLNAFDEQIQSRELDPSALAPVARMMSVGDILVRNDIQWERYRLIRPEYLWQWLTPTPAGLDPPKGFGPTHGITAPARYPFDDEQRLGAPVRLPAPPALAVFGLQDAKPVLRTEAANRPVILSGDGQGVVDAAAAGLLDGNSALLYSAAFGKDAARVREQAQRDGVLVVSDSNRVRARRWSTVYDTTGFTEGPHQQVLTQDLSDARLGVFPDAPSDAFTTTEQRGVRDVRVSAYGNPISYTPENRAVRAFDGDPDTAWAVGAFADVTGERIRVDLAHPITTDHVNLMQPLKGDRDRYITKATLRFDGGHDRSITLDQRSRVRAGQTVHFPRRRFRSFEIRIDGTNRGRLTNYAGTSAVGFGEIRLRDDKPGAKDVQVDEVLRMPTDLLRAAGPVSASRPLVFLMDRERVYPVPPRYDPELTLTREMSVPTSRSFTVSGEVRLASTADAEDLDRLLGYDGPIRVNASSGLAAAPASRASAALDGDPTTAWVTRFRDPRHQWLKVQVPQPITVDHLDLQVVADGYHSVPTQLTLTNEAGDTRTIDLPPVTDGRVRNAVAPAPVRFPPITGTTFKVSIEAYRPVKTFDFYCACEEVMPVGIAELGMAGVPPVRVPAELPPTCRTDVLSLDGRPIPIMVRGSTADALALKPLDLAPCDPADGRITTALGRGTHVVRTWRGDLRGLNIDRLVLASDASGASAPQLGPYGRFTSVPGAPAPSPVHLEIRSQGRVRTTARLVGATRPVWLVLGQSSNLGWHARVNGRDLGAPVTVDGYANGWLVEPAADGRPLSITIEWVPERTVIRAIVVSIAAFVACLGIVVVAWTRRRRRNRAATGTRVGRAVAAVGDAVAAPGPLPTAPDEPLLVSPLAPAARAGPLGAVVAVAIALVGGAVIVAPWVGVALAAVVLLVLLRPRERRLLALFPPFAIAFCGAYIAVKQWYGRLPPTFEWPTFFWQVRTLGWLAVVVLAADGLVELVTRRARAPDPP